MNKVDWFIVHWNIEETLKFVLKLSWWNLKQIKISLKIFNDEKKDFGNAFIFSFTKKLKEKIAKKQITNYFIWSTVFGSIYPDFLDDELVVKFYEQFESSSERKKVLEEIQACRIKKWSN